MAIVVLIVSAIVCFCSIPLIKGQLASDLVGIDFWCYYAGSKIDNPYLPDNLFGTAPGESMSEQQAYFSFLKARGGIGYVAFPFNQLLFYPLSYFFSFTTALRLFITMSVGMISGIITLFSLKLTEKRTRTEKVFYTGILNVIFFTMFFPVISSLVTGQIDALVIFFMGLSIYLFAFHRQKLWPSFVGSFFLAVAGGIKLYPLIILFRYLPELFSRFKNNIGLDKLKVMNTVTGVMLIYVLTSLWVGTASTMVAWFHKFQQMYLLLGTTTSKTTLHRYVSMIPVWLFGSTGGVAFQYIIPGLCAATAYYFAIKYIAQARDSVELPKFTLLITLLPMILSHWYYYYNVIMILPMIMLFFYAQKVENKKLKKGIFSLLGGGFIFSNDFTKMAIVQIFPSLRDWFWNLTAQDVYTYFKYFRGVDPAKYIEKIIATRPSIAACLIGFPGLLMLFIANLLVVKYAPAEGTSENVEKSGEKKLDSPAGEAVEQDILSSV